MILPVDGVLSEDELARVRRAMAALSWRDGARTAGRAAAEVKANLQAELGGAAGGPLKRDLLRAVSGHPVVRAAALPRRFGRLLLSRTGEGGGYGLHADAAMMPAEEDGEREEGGALPDRIRTDLSFTLFLSPPNAYEGGALEIVLAHRTESFRLPAGSLLLYPTGALHRVAPVTSGERVVAAGWIESRVPAAADREILFDLANLREALAARGLGPQSPERLTLQKAAANLERRLGAP